MPRGEFVCSACVDSGFELTDLAEREDKRNEQSKAEDLLPYVAPSDLLTQKREKERAKLTGVRITRVYKAGAADFREPHSGTVKFIPSEHPQYRFEVTYDDGTPAELCSEAEIRKWRIRVPRVAKPKKVVAKPGVAAVLFGVVGMTDHLPEQWNTSSEVEWLRELGLIGVRYCGEEWSEMRAECAKEWRSRTFCVVAGATVCGHLLNALSFKGFGNIVCPFADSCVLSHMLAAAQGLSVIENSVRQEVDGHDVLDALQVGAYVHWSAMLSGIDVIVAAPMPRVQTLVFFLFQMFAEACFCVCMQVRDFMDADQCVRDLVNDAGAEERLLLIVDLPTVDGDFMWVCVFRDREMRDRMCVRDENLRRSEAMWAQQWRTYPFLRTEFKGL